MRVAIALVMGLLVAAVVAFGLAIAVFALGGTECDRGACNWLGESFADAPNVFWAAYFVIGAVAGAGVGRRLARETQ